MTYGHRIIEWADTRFAHRFAGGSLPAKPTGVHYTKQCWADFVRTSVAAIIAAAIIAAFTWLIADSTRTGALTGWYGILGVIMVMELI